MTFLKNKIVQRLLNEITVPGALTFRFSSNS